MSMIVTITDPQADTIVWGTVHEWKCKANGDLVIALTKYHCPCQSKDGHTHNGFEIP
jgi:hypothetical protein